jgi:hypothetical protein
VAIRLRDECLDDHLIAVALGIDVDQVRTTLEIADGKLANLMAAESNAPYGITAPITHMHHNPTNP